LQKTGALEKNVQEPGEHGGEHEAQGIVRGDGLDGVQLPLKDGARQPEPPGGVNQEEGQGYRAEIAQQGM